MTDLDNRVGKLEADVSGLKVDTAKISTTLDAMKERQEERHVYLVKGIDKIEESLDTLTRPSTAGPSKWIKEVITPQTVAIVLAIVASALGAPVVAKQVLGTTAPVIQAVEALEEPASPSAEP